MIQRNKPIHSLIPSEKSRTQFKYSQLQVEDGLFYKRPVVGKFAQFVYSLCCKSSNFSQSAVLMFAFCLKGGESIPGMVKLA